MHIESVKIGRATWIVVVVSCLTVFGAQIAAVPESRQNHVGPKGTISPLDSTIEGNTYTNKYFRFKFTFPKGWIVVSEPGKSSQQQTEGATSLLLVMDGNSAPLAEHRRIGIVANKLKTAKTSIPNQLRAGAEVLKRQNLHLQLAGDPERLNVQGHAVWRQKIVEMEHGKRELVILFAMERRGYALQFVIWSPDEADSNLVINEVSFFRALP